MKLPIYIDKHGTSYILYREIPKRLLPEFDKWFTSQTGILLDDGSLGIYPWDWDNFIAHIEGRPEFFD